MDWTFLDTSAVLAFFVSADKYHQEAKRLFAYFMPQPGRLLTTSYVLNETYALLGRRAGLTAVRAFRKDFEPYLDIVWVDALLHSKGLDLLLERSVRRLSLVDTVSFLVIQDLEISDVLAFDGHFDDEGFKRPALPH
jgi:uncharacterized protein